ncbi:hypothetical protein HanPSC8_Chr09g0374161 [Helianthus annuus]|nr:hypothetical protein HanPSC8_Chr09g0374161 [Helianthus annuus]
MLLVPFLQRKKVHDVIAGLINTYFQMLLHLSTRCKDISWICYSVSVMFRTMVFV